jgi:heparin binding hemagglutinin HbhA
LTKEKIMSVVDDFRSYAEIALEQGKTIAGQAQARLGSVSDEARGQASAASEDAKRFADTVAGLTRKQAFVLLGAADLAVTAVTKRTEGLSADARSGAEKVASSVDSLQYRAQSYAADLRGKSEKAVADAKGFKASQGTTAARQAVDAYVEQAKTVLDMLAERGEKVAERLRKTPRLAVVVSLVDRTEDEPVSRPVAKPAAKKAPARKKAPAKKAPAKKAPAKKAPAKKAATSA